MSSHLGSAPSQATLTRLELATLKQQQEALVTRNAEIQQEINEIRESFRAALGVAKAQVRTLEKELSHTKKRPLKLRAPMTFDSKRDKLKGFLANMSIYLKVNNY